MGKYPSKKIEGHTDLELLAIIAARKASAFGAEQGELSDRRQNNLDRYMGEPYGDERRGQSSVVTRQCLEAVEWSLPSLMRVFASSDRIAEFVPTGPEDEEAARQESDYVNRVFSQENSGFSVLYTWFKDILMNPNGYIKVYWDDAEEVTTEEYRGLTEPELLMLMEDPELEPMEQEIISDTSVAGGMPLYSVKFSRTRKTGKVEVIPVPPEELLIDGKLGSVSLENADFVCHTTYKTRSELIELGYDKDTVNELSTADGERNEDDEREHRHYITAGSDGSEDETTDRSTQLVAIDESYLHVDYDGDGIAEFRVVTSSGKEVLANEETDYLPFVAGCAVPLPHSHIGMSWLELVEDLQKIYTTLTRQMLNNLYRTNNPRTVVGPGVNLNDIINDLPNSPIRTRDVNQIRLEPTQSVVQNILPAFSELDKAKETRTGVSRSTMGLDADSLSRVTKGAFLGSLEQANQRLELLARILAEYSVKPLFLKIHKLLLTHQTATVDAKIAGEWITVNPSEWREREDMNVLVGLGTGNRQAQGSALEKILELQAAMVQNGGMGTMVTPENIFNSASRLVEVAGLHSPEKYFTDPAKAQQQQMPQQPGEGDALAAAQMELAKVEREKAQMEHQAKVQKLQLDMQTAQAKHQRELADMNAKLQAKTRELQLKGRDLTRKEHEMLIKADIEQARIMQKDLSEIDARQAAAEKAMPMGQGGGQGMRPGVDY